MTCQGPGHQQGVGGCPLSPGVSLPSHLDLGVHHLIPDPGVDGGVGVRLADQSHRLLLAGVLRLLDSLDHGGAWGQSGRTSHPTQFLPQHEEGLGSLLTPTWALATALTAHQELGLTQRGGQEDARVSACAVGSVHPAMGRGCEPRSPRCGAHRAHISACSGGSWRGPVLESRPLLLLLLDGMADPRPPCCPLTGTRCAGQAAGPPSAPCPPLATGAP